MTTNYGQATTQDRMAPTFEALFKEMVQSGTYPKVTSRAEDTALAEALIVTLKTTISQTSPYERALFVTALAPAIAEALAPVIAEALAPALVSALSNMAASEKAGQEAGPGGGPERQEGQ